MRADPPLTASSASTSRYPDVLPGTPAQSPPQTKPTSSLLKAALVALTGVGGLSLVTMFAFYVLVLSASPTRYVAPVFDLLVSYANRGQNVRFCRTTSEPGQPTIIQTSCSSITDATPLPDAMPMLRDGEFIWVEFERAALNTSELIQFWGQPRLLWVDENRAGLQWELATLGLRAWLVWGDPHETPRRALLTLEAVGGRGSIGPDR